FTAPGRTDRPTQRLFCRLQRSLDSAVPLGREHRSAGAQTALSTPREQAEREARERRVDRTVRIVAESGRHDEAGHTYWRPIRLEDGATLHLRATFGAGANSASAHHSLHRVVYEALDYGRSLVAFRVG